jgi:hypothetical protein
MLQFPYAARRLLHELTLVIGSPKGAIYASPGRLSPGNQAALTILKPQRATP